MSVENVSREEWIVSGLALFLVVDLLFLPWLSVSIGPITITAKATDAPNGIFGVLGLLAAVTYLVDVGAEKMSGAQLPVIGGSRERTRLVIAAVCAGCVVLKLLLHTSNLGWGSWLGVVAAAALVAVNARPDLLQR